MNTKFEPGKPRNPLHNHPLMRKGGVHKQSQKALRHQEKQKLKKEWGYLIALITGAINQLYSRVRLEIRLI